MPRARTFKYLYKNLATVRLCVCVGKIFELTKYNELKVA